MLVLRVVFLVLLAQSGIRPGNKTGLLVLSIVLGGYCNIACFGTSVICRLNYLRHDLLLLLHLLKELMLLELQHLFSHMLLLWVHTVRGDMAAEAKTVLK